MPRTRLTREQKCPDTKYFKFYNANPDNHYTSDCVIRALSLALDKPWGATLIDLTRYAMENSLMPNDKACYGKYLEKIYGYKKHAHPVDGKGKKMTGKKFCASLPDGHKPIIAHIGAHHIVCIKDKKIYDTWDCSDDCIGNYWQEL